MKMNDCTWVLKWTKTLDICCRSLTHVGFWLVASSGVTLAHFIRTKLKTVCLEEWLLMTKSTKWEEYRLCWVHKIYKSNVLKCM